MVAEIRNLIEESIILPQDDSKLETFKSVLVANVVSVFGLNTDSKQKGLNDFLENGDHGLQHVFNVYNKAVGIAKEFEQKTGQKVNRYKLYIMAVSHDSGRFHITDMPEEQERSDKKRDRCEKRHNVCGVAQMRLGKSRILKSSGTKLLKRDRKGLENDYSEIADYVFNHDFMNARLEDSKYSEPTSIEGQIVRLADRISTDVETEIQRYWDTGKRRKTKFFDRNISLQDRFDFNFRDIGKYIKDGKLDQFYFFLALISVSEHDFGNPVLKEIYKEWAGDKHKSVDKILTLAKEEGYSNEDIQEMERVIREYMVKFDIKF